MTHFKHFNILDNVHKLGENYISKKAAGTRNIMLPNEAQRNFPSLYTLIDPREAVMKKRAKTPTISCHVV
jgi:hypothetical protein